jgi:acyl dehydratase
MMSDTLRAVLPGRGDTMPGDVLERAVRVQPGELAQYAHVCGFTLRDELPPTYPHVLAHPLHLALLSRAPFSAVGVVHIANRIVQHRPLLLGEELALTVRISELRPHRRGRVFDFVSELRAGDELVWEEVSTNLKRGDGDDSLPRDGEFELPPVRAQWRLPDDLGRRYAAVSGDHNPIHLHSWAAKPFGFPRAIAHGMWTKARCLAGLRLQDAFTAEVRFKKPILLPSTVTFGEAGGRFAVHGHLEGLYESLTHKPGSD